MQSSIKHLLKHFALVLKAKLNQLKPFVRFVFQPSTLLHPPINQFIKGLHTQTFFTLLYASFSCPYGHNSHPLFFIRYSLSTFIRTSQATSLLLQAQSSLLGLQLAAGLFRPLVRKLHSSHYQ